jgi:hypothetical protein
LPRRPSPSANLKVAGELLGVAHVRLVNLCGLATTDLPSLSSAATTVDVWRAAQPDLVDALIAAEVLVFAYGLGGFVGSARHHFRGQVRWLHETAHGIGHRNALMLDGRPRHPSRWRQYLGPQRGLFTQPTFEDRLRAALRLEPLYTSTRA